MRQAHTPPHAPQPGQPGEPHIDQVAGDPPVPITVWRTPPGDDQSTVPARLAERLVEAYSRPGEAVIDLTDDHALADATVTGGRRHHRGWFTDASALIIGPGSPPPPTDAGTGAAGTATGGGRGTAPTRTRRRARGEIDPPGLAAWFGDDLTEDLPPADGTRPQPGTDTVRGTTSLVVACWPLSAVDATNRARLGWLLHACVQLLRPGGCLVLVVAAPTGVTAAPEDFGPLVDTANDARLGYLQHIVAVRADVDGDQFVYYATDEELLALAQGGEAWKVAHLTVHADLLVFTPSHAGGARG
jgi:hypothetical protein